MPLEGSTLAVGAMASYEPGAVYLYTDDGLSWIGEQKVQASDGSLSNELGSSVVLSGSRLVVGARDGGAQGTAACLSQITYLGSPSATSSGDFRIRAFAVLPIQFGLLVYSQSAASTPFMGGTLCIGAPIWRTPPQTSTGTLPPGFDCSGTLTFQMNHWIQTGSDPLLVPGATVYAQFWFRDPLDPFGIGLTDALEFVIHP